jgi:ribosome-associated protein
MPRVRVGMIDIPEADLTWTAVRASGPGGQNVNKVASKVELRFDLAGTRALSEAVKARLRALAGGRIDRYGVLLVTSQKHRDQPRNLEDARDKLAALIAEALVPPRPRRPTRPTRGSVERRIGAKKRRSAAKKDRRSADD